MPVISKFNGYKITMYYKDHMPPHIHVEYNGNKSTIEINNVNNIKGDIKKKDLKVIQRWIKLRQKELIECWNLIINNEEPIYIKPYNKKED